MRNKLILSAFVLATAALLASFTPRSGGTPGAASVDPYTLTLAQPALSVSPQADAF
jgi:hypothetical protein